MDYQELADILFPDTVHSPDYYENLFPERELPKGAVVSRIGPSPTGFVHLGNLYNAIIGERLAHQSKGVFFLRIEDTDSKREVEGAVNLIISSMNYFNIQFDEGASKKGDSGKYAPYRQRERKNIYQSFAKHLVEKGLAYPCFCTEDELREMRNQQEQLKQNFGYYGKWAVYRNADIETVKNKIAEGVPYVLRFKSNGSETNFIKINDGIRGELRVQENYQDFVLLKSDGIPTYHFAHVVDDHLMRTTHVVRGEEWLSTLPIHIQLFDTFGWQEPVYCHTPQLMKLDGSSKRKLSKRKDPEFSLEYYTSEGYIPETLWTYILTVLNSDFEEWFSQNPEKNYSEFVFSLDKMSSSGALFDTAKLNDIGKEVISRLSAEKVYSMIDEWSSNYNKPFNAEFTKNKEYTLKILNIGRNIPKPRKDIYNWKQGSQYLSFFFDSLFVKQDCYPENVSDKSLTKTVLCEYLETFDFNDTQEQWFEKIRAISQKHNYALQPKKYKKNPELYNGSIVDISNVIRVAMTGRLNSPDIYEITKAMGSEKALERIKLAISELQEGKM